LPRNSETLINCVLFNARSIVNKLPEWYHLIYACNYDIIFVTETWLSNQIPSSMLDLHDGYSVIRCDRKDSRGGGVCCLVSKKLKHREIEIPSRFSSLELCCFDVCFSKYSFRFFNVYLKPGVGQGRANEVSLLVDCLSYFL